MRPILAIVLVIWAGLALADDWPIFRGPARNGVSAEKDWTHQWPGGEPKQLFKVNVKSGFSCPVVRGDRLWTMGHLRGRDTVVCLDANTGNEIWAYSYEALRVGTVQPDYEGTRSTPTLDGDRLYTLSRDGKVFCFEAAGGAVKWQKDLSKDPGAAIPPWGFSSSAIVHGELLIFNVGTAGVALDKSNGEVTWATDNAVSGYATPLEYQAGGKSRLAMFTADSVACVDAETGKRVWSVPWKTQYKINSADPIFSDGKLFVSSAYNFGCAVIDVATDRPKIVWQNKALKNHYNASVLHGGHVYGFDGNNYAGQGLKCLEFGTGKVKWETPQPAWGNLIVADGKLIICSQNGELVVAKASSEKYQELARAHPLGGTSWTAPVLCDGRLYLRNTQGDLVGLDLRTMAH
jgi:outer membrane protein assembly factor BamB